MATQTVDATPVTHVPRGTVSPNLVSMMRDVFEPETGFLAKYNVERRDQIEILGISTAAGLDPLYVGDPGVGKTWMVELFLLTLDLPPEKFFNTLVFKETPADDILGMRNLPAMKAGRIERMMEGYLPTAVVAYLDEIFKSSPTLANALLDVMAQRKLKVGRTVHKLDQLLLVVGSSNELPDREDMLPFRDRWAITNHVPIVQTPEGRKAVLRIQDDYQANGSRIDTNGIPKLSESDLQQIRAEVRSVIIPDAVVETLNECIELWTQKGFTPSTRRTGQMLAAIKGRAWMRGDGTATTDDIIVTKDMAWNHPDHAKDAMEVVMKFANVFARKATRAQEALEPVLVSLDELKKKINEAGGSATAEQQEEFDEAGWKILKQIRGMRKDIRADIEAGSRQGQDIRALEGVMENVNRAHAWIETTLVGDE